MSKRTIFIKNVIGVILLIVGLIWLSAAALSHSVKYTITKVNVLDSSDTATDRCEVLFTYQRGGKELTGSFTKTVPSGELPSVGAQGKCYFFSFIPDRIFLGDAPGCEIPLVFCLIGMIVILFTKKKVKLSKEDSHV